VANDKALMFFRTLFFTY